MLEVKSLFVPSLDNNYIWLIKDSEAPYVAIVDPGRASPVIEALQQNGWQPTAILITHHHADHVGGIEGLLEHYDIPVYGPSNESIPALSHPLKEGDRVNLDGLGLTLKVLDIPGHTLGHIAYYGEGCLFCGDTLFTAGSGRLFEGTPEQMVDSIDKLRSLPAETQVYCAHEYTKANLEFAQVIDPENPLLQQRVKQDGEKIKAGVPTVPSALSTELATNPFMRWDNPAIKAACESFSGEKLTSDGAVFRVIRHWKDSLD